MQQRRTLALRGTLMVTGMGQAVVARVKYLMLGDTAFG